MKNENEKWRRNDQREGWMRLIQKSCLFLESISPAGEERWHKQDIAWTTLNIVQTQYYILPNFFFFFFSFFLCVRLTQTYI